MTRISISIPILFILSGLFAPVASADSVRQLMRRGEALESQLRSEEALKVFQEAERQKPDNVKVLCKIAKQYSDLINDVHTPAEQKVRAQLALAYSKRAVALDPNESDANLVMAVSYCKLTPYITTRERVLLCDDIKNYAERAIALDPKSDYAYHLLGRWHQEVARISPLEKTIGQALYGKIPDASLDDALALLDKARKLRPDRLIHQLEYGRTLVMMGRVEEGRREINKGLAMPNREKDDPESKDRARRTLASV